MNITQLVEKTASDLYMNNDLLADFIADYDEFNLAQLMGACIGLSGEVGEFSELVKKYVFQGADFDRQKAIKELGDIRYYYALACIALNVSIEEVETTLIDKLSKRYKNGFTVEESNNREKEE